MSEELIFTLEVLVILLLSFYISLILYASLNKKKKFVKCYCPQCKYWNTEVNGAVFGYCTRKEKWTVSIEYCIEEISKKYDGTQIFYKLSCPNSYFTVCGTTEIEFEHTIYIYGPQKPSRGNAKTRMPLPPLSIPIDSPCQIYNIFTKLKLKYSLNELVSWECQRRILIYDLCNNVYST